MPLPAAAPHIGIFDSGIGGLSVLRAVRRQLPAARCTYVADAAHTPWGERPAAWVAARCAQLSAWLLAEGADLVLVACNTATTQAIAALRERWPHAPFVGVEPGIKPAVAASRNHRVALMATAGTLRSARLAQLLRAHASSCTLLSLPCTGLAQAIEQAGEDEAALAGRLDDIAAALRQTGADTVVLGCTHYPLVADALARRLGPGVLLVDTADAVARRVASLLAAPDGPPQPGAAPVLRLLSTGAPGQLQHAARRWVDPDVQAEALHLPEPPGAAARGL